MLVFIEISPVSCCSCSCLSRAQQEKMELQGFQELLVQRYDHPKWLWTGCLVSLCGLAQSLMLISTGMEVKLFVIVELLEFFKCYIWTYPHDNFVMIKWKAKGDLTAVWFYTYLIWCGIHVSLGKINLTLEVIILTLLLYFTFLGWPRVTWATWTKGNIQVKIRNFSGCLLVRRTNGTAKVLFFFTLITSAGWMWVCGDSRVLRATRAYWSTRKERSTRTSWSTRTSGTQVLCRGDPIITHISQLLTCFVW